MKQLTLARVGFERYGKTTRRAVFLAEMERVVPWPGLCGLIEPFYPKPGNGRPPIGVERMLRIYFLQQWFNLSDPAVEEALYDSMTMRDFVGIDLGREPVPDETTVCRFRHLLEQHDLGRQLFDEVQRHLVAKGLKVATGTIVDATIIIQDEDHLVVLQGQRLREAALFFPGKRVLQIVAGAQRPMQVLLIRRRLGKTRIVISHERRQQGVSFSQAADPGKPQLLDQPVLQGLVRTLDPALGLARIGADDVNVQSMQSAPKLGHPVAADRSGLVDAKHPMLVAVERHGLAPGFEVGAGRMKIGKGRFTFDKLEVHQPTRRVVDEHEQRALWATILKPPVLAAVNLHELANAVAPGAGLMNALSPLLAIEPQPSLDHPQPQCLTTERDPMNLAQLLGRQRRSEIPVPLADDRQHRFP